MARNGSGVYSLPAGQPVVTGTTISSTVHNTLMSDIAGALTTSIASDGQTTPTADLKMGGYKLRNLANAAVSTDAVNLGQVQGSAFCISAAGGTADAITATFTPAIASLTNGLTLYVRAGSANATTTPTFTPNSGTVAAKTIVKGAGAAVVAGDISGAGHWLILQYDQTLDKWVLANPATGIAAAYFLARDEKAQGTNGGSSAAGVQTRTLNTQVANTISGASLAANQITLPAGTYRVNAHTPANGPNLVQAWLWNVTDSTATIKGTSENGTLGGGADSASVRSFVNGRFTITSSKVFELRLYTDSVIANTGLGATDSQTTEVYSVFELIKVS